MGYNLTWLVEKRVVYLKLFDSVSSDDLVDCNEQTVQYIMDGTQPIHVILDLLDVKSFPSNLRWVIHMIKGNPIKAAGYRIVIDNDPTMRILLMAILSVLHVPIHACNTVEEANTFLATLENSPYAVAR